MIIPEGSEAYWDLYRRWEIKEIPWTTFQGLTLIDPNDIQSIRENRRMLITDYMLGIIGDDKFETKTGFQPRAVLKPHEMPARSGFSMSRRSSSSSGSPVEPEYRSSFEAEQGKHYSSFFPMPQEVRKPKIPLYVMNQPRHGDGQIMSPDSLSVGQEYAVMDHGKKIGSVVVKTKPGGRRPFEVEYSDMKGNTFKKHLDPVHYGLVKGNRGWAPDLYLAILKG